VADAITLEKALYDGLNAAGYAESGFTQLEDLLKAIKHFATLTGADHLATIASAAMTVAQEFQVIAEDYTELFEAARAELKSHPRAPRRLMP
jgi:hypothetical protein